MSEISLSEDGEFAPKIRKSLDLQDLSLKTVSGPFAPTDFDKMRPEPLCLDGKVCNEAPKSRAVQHIPTQRRMTSEAFPRQKLVDADEFRETMIALARRSTREPRSRPAPENPRPINLKLSATPLVEALAQAAEHRKAVMELASKFESPPDLSFPVTPVKLTQEEKMDSSDQSSPSEPSNNMHQTRTISRRCSVQGSSNQVILLQSEGNDESVHVKNKLFRIDFASIPIHDTVKLVRIMEKVAARKILRAWRKGRKATEKYRLEIRKMKSFMKEVVISALKANKQIRDELRGIRDNLLKKAEAEPACPAAPPDSLPLSSYLETLSVHPKIGPFKSARLLLDSSVKSPKMIDFLINDLILGEHRNAVRLCVGQPTLHPKALVVVIFLDSVSPEEWLARISKSSHVFAYDKAFPLTQGSAGCVPWEVLIRKHMSDIYPDWIEFSRRNLTHNSLS